MEMFWKKYKTTVRNIADFQNIQKLLLQYSASFKSYIVTLQRRILNISVLNSVLYSGDVYLLLCKVISDEFNLNVTHKYM